MKKFTRILAAAAALVLTLSVAGCNNGSDNGGTSTLSYPSFINPESFGAENPVASEKYVVNVLSEGGLKLNNVKVAAKRGGVVVKRGISVDGKIEFAVGLNEYELEIDPDSLPDGYYLPEGVTYTTNAEKREEVTIRIPSKVIDASAAVSSYAVGNIMRDFTFTDCYGAKYTLSKLLETKKAVVINFFFTTCGPCAREFPAIQRAYQNRVNNDVEVLAMSTTANRDSDDTVSNFKSTNKITFPMGIDRIGLTPNFQNGYPTTIVIDRYGLIAYRTFGGQDSTTFWSNLFSKYASPTYVQDVHDSGSGSGTGTGVKPVKPTEQMPASSELESAALGANTQAVFSAEDNEYSWPWKAGTDADGGYIYSTNKGVDNSYAIVHATLKMKKDQVLSFDYKISSESNADKFYVMLDGDLMNDGWSGDHNDVWSHADIYVADRDKTVDLAFTYLKDAGDVDDGSSGEDTVKIKNITLSDKSTIVNSLDVMRTCASDKSDLTYDYYVDYEYYDPDKYEGGDGFYHVVLEREEPVEDETKGEVKKWGPIIYLTLNQLTPWSDLHTGNTLTGLDGLPYSATLFKMTEQMYVNTEGEVTVIIGNQNVTEAYTVYVLIMPYMEAPFYLIPVTPLLKSWADAFVTAFEKGNQHENEWLEFCYYYDHYGAEHDDETYGDGKECKVDEDYTRGLTTLNAHTAYEKTELAQMAANGEIADSATYNAATGRNRATIHFPLQLTHNGAYYKFTASKKGVYQIRSYTTGCSPSGSDDSDFVTADPSLQIYDSKNNFLLISGEPADFDYVKGEEYEGFNEYISLEAGETIYLYLETSRSTRSYYDFEIEWLGETAEKLFFCAESSMWIPNTDEEGNTYWVYPCVDMKYDDSTDCYYATKNGQIDYDQPVYINMLYDSFLVNERTQYNYQSLKTMIEDSAFENYLWHGELYQPVMYEYLGKSTEGKSESDWDYGLVKANREIVDILNMYISQNVENVPGQTTGWTAWAVYVAQLGK